MFNRPSMGTSRWTPEQLRAQQMSLKHVSQSDISDLSSAVPILQAPDGTLLAGSCLGDMVLNIFQHFKHRPCIGVRPQGWDEGLGALKPADAFEFKTYEDIENRIRAFGIGFTSWLRRLMEPTVETSVEAPIDRLYASRQPLTHEGSQHTPFVAILSDVSLEAIVVDFACVTQGLAPIFLPLGLPPTYLATLLGQLQPLAICVATNYALVLDEALASQPRIESIRFICHLPVPPQKSNRATVSSGSQIHSSPAPRVLYEDLVDEGLLVQQTSSPLSMPSSSPSPPPFRRGKMTDIFTLIYTSGSTSIPKGAVRSARSWHDYIR